jgi:hypothetical protein
MVIIFATIIPAAIDNTTVVTKTVILVSKLNKVKGLLLC